eukprot:g5653.t1
MSFSLPLQRATIHFKTNNESNPHVLSIEANDSVLHVELTHIPSDERWSNAFSASQIEKLTRQTRNFKSFPLFVKMLSAAQMSKSDSVWVDVLTFNDLKEMRAKNGGRDCPDPSNVDELRKKRYLVLTYNVEFDRIHWPLPLVPVEESEEERLKRTVRRLQNELKHAKLGSGKENLPLAEEFSHHDKESDLSIARTSLFELEEKYAKIVKVLSETRGELAETKKKLEEERLAHRTFQITSRRERTSAATELRDIRRANQELRRKLRNMERKQNSYVATSRNRTRSRSASTTRSAKSKGFSKPHQQQARKRSQSRNRKGKGRTRAPLRPRGQSASALKRNKANGVARGRSVSVGRRTAISNSPHRVVRYRQQRKKSLPKDKKAGNQKNRGRSVSRGRARSRSRSTSRCGRFDPTAFVRGREKKIRQSQERKLREVRRMQGENIRASRVSGWGGAWSKVEKMERKSRSCSRNRNRNQNHVHQDESDHTMFEKEERIDIPSQPLVKEKHTIPSKKVEEEAHPQKENVESTFLNREDDPVSNGKLDVTVLKRNDISTCDGSSSSSSSWGASSIEIAEIDERLNKLQDFLKAAKSGSSISAFPRN